MVKELVALFALATTGIALIQGSRAAESQTALRPIATIALPNVAGRIDHLGLDAARQRLFVAALGNNSIEVIDTAKNVHLQSLRGFHEPQGVAVLPDLTAVAIANGDTGTLELVDTATLQRRALINIGEDADNVRYEAAAKRLFVAYKGGIAIVDPSPMKVVQRISISGHPESFQFESQGTRLFANLPGASQIIVADRKSAAAVARWPTGACEANYPMAFDEATQRLMAGCRHPASLTLFDTETGKAVGLVLTVGDTDDLFYDASRRRVYVMGGEGYVDVVQRDGDSLRRTARVPTRDGARTGQWDAERARLYVAVPARRGLPAEIRVFAAQ
jgi:DNA-binding beta-propeller fold protein YncE